MTYLNQPEDINEESLKTLIRGITRFPEEFSLILAHCNYSGLRERIAQQLREQCTIEQCTVEIRDLVLDKSVQTLYTTIAKELGQEQPDALMVFGLESVSELDRVLKATNQIREEFRNFAFLLVLWVTDEVLQKLIRLVPDFYSWATTVEFKLTTEELIHFIEETIDRVFAKILASRENIFVQEFDSIHCAEVQSAGQELKNRGVKLDPELEAGLEFVLGRLADSSQEESRQHYERSLELCRQGNKLEKCGHSLFSLGRWWRNYAVRNRNEYQSACDHTQEYFRQCIQVFEQANKPELAAKYINYWAEILHRLKQWDKLEEVATKALNLHQTYPDKFKQARAYGFLAEVALAKSDWTKAQESAQRAISLIDNELKAITSPSEEQQILLDWVNSFHRGWYLFSLGKAQKQLGQVEKAISTLETARDTIKPNDDPGLYIGILEELREGYFQQGEYLTAFEIKQERRAIKSQFNFSAFIGAGRLQPKQQVTNAALPSRELEKTQVFEFAASGREQDIKRLVGRMYRNDIKLTVIYGQSGVGKSSIIEAGLIPALKGEIINTRRVLPVLQRVYSDWVGELEKCLANSGFDSSSSSIQESPPNPPILGGTRFESNSIKESSSSLSIQESPPNPPILGGNGNIQKSPTPLLLGEGIKGRGDGFRGLKSIIEELKNNSKGNLLTVLIFDQFEEFFFDCQEPKQRKDFYDFLQQCLELPFVKVILSLREDYLHYLLECNRLNNLEAVNNNILDKNILYYLGNFTTDDAKSVIRGLTKHTQFSLKPKLVEKLVQDLAAEIGEVRPIELQVVGAQLQAENITTLEKYQESGTKEQLVERYLAAVVKDCSKANKKIAQLILYLLTDEKNTRPLKTKEDLVTGLAGLGVETKAEQLDLVLTILVGSGLVFMVPAPNADQYQLVHDYLAAFVRKQQEQGLVKELREAKERQQQTQAKLNRFLKYAVAGSIVFIVGLTITTVNAIQARRQAEIGEIRALGSSATSLLASHQEIEALMEALKMGGQLKKTFRAKANEQIEAVTALQKVVYAVRERNRLEGHSDVVNSVSFSPDGKTIASAGAIGDQTVKLWNLDGTLLKTLRGHSDGVNSVSFSPDGKTIASASVDKTVKLWSIDGKLLHTLQGHTDWVWGVSFSPDGKTIASASVDDTVKLWNLDGKLITTFPADQGGINEVDFSPDGKTIVSAGNDGTVKLWNLDGTLRQTFDAHISWVLSVSFSPDGKTIVSGGRDNTVKLWNLDGTLRRTIQGHGDNVNSVSFSPDGKIIASASYDQTIKLWKLDGTLLKTIQGHDGSIWGINFSPDGKTLASASADYTVKLWSLDETLLKTIPGHFGYVQSVSFSPDGKTIASASNDRTVKLWSRDGTLLQTLRGHNDTVEEVSFSPDGKTIASASWDGTVKLWNLYGSLLRTLPGHSGVATSVSFSPDGKTLVSGGSDSNVKLWSLDGTLLKTFSGHSNTVTSVSFSPDGKTIASASYDQTVKLWSLDGNLLKTLQGHDDWFYRVSFSPDGKTVASASRDNTVKLWSLDGILLKTIPAHSDYVRSVSFSPDGKTLATASDDSTVKLWSLDGKLLKILQGHKTNVANISFSPDGKTLASPSWDKTVILWNLDEWTMDVDALLERGCDWLADYLSNRPEKLEELKICQTSSLLKRAAPALVAQGEELAKDGKVEEAIANFQKALKWDSTLDLNPETEALTLMR
ncbi:MAG: tetratricopeptide repeat protein [Xenococcaceae cyanobacterium MO_207.B15]|nr:tetratricopeptide repeat protein [Xenococcaceae cyanobacterium MO_207.B15]